MLRKGLLASAGVLALIVPEVFQAFFESLRQSEYLLLYQAGCVVWTAILAGAMVPWHKVLRRNPKARIRVEVKPGTARMGQLGMVSKATSNLLITNEGPPVNLIAHAKLTNVASGFTWAKEDAWSTSRDR